MGITFPYIFDEKCAKRGFIILILKNYIRDCFLRRRSLSELETIQKLFVSEMQTYCSVKKDFLIQDCVEYFMVCKSKLEKGQQHTK